MPSSLGPGTTVTRGIDIGLAVPTTHSTVEFDGLRLVSTNVGRCLPALYRYEADTVTLLPSAPTLASNTLFGPPDMQVGLRFLW